MTENKQQPNILIIDDEKDILSTCKVVLEDEGYEVSTAENYNEALDNLKVKNIDLVFLDVWLPEVDGLDILSNIKQSYPNIPVIMMSGHAGVETAVRATKMGAYDFLEKPISVDKLISSCNKLIKRKSGDICESKNIRNNEQDKHDENSKYKIHQKTIAKSVVVSGFALMEGRKTALTLVPAPPDTGIVFVDIITNTRIKLSPENILSKDGSGYVNSTVLVKEDRYIRTTEHLLAALHMYGITNLIVKCDGEVPNVDGSALVFCNALEEAGYEEQDVSISPIVIDDTFTYGKVDDKETYVILSPFDGFEVTLRIDFNPPIGIQKYTYRFESFEQFTREIGRARSFNSIDNIDYAQKKGMAGSGMIGSHILLSEGKVINTKLHFEDEFVRHKILDIIGDMYILGRPVKCRITANKSSHAFNHEVVWDIAKRYL